LSPDCTSQKKRPRQSTTRVLPSIGDDSFAHFPKKGPLQTVNLPASAAAFKDIFSQKESMDFLGRRRKTLSESSSSSIENKPAKTGANAQTSAAVEGRCFYDDKHGKVPFSYFERKPEFYDDIDGKVTYKYFNQYRHLKTREEVKKDGQDGFLYCVDGGKVPYRTYTEKDREKFKSK